MESRKTRRQRARNSRQVGTDTSGQRPKNKEVNGMVLRGRAQAHRSLYAKWDRWGTVMSPYGARRYYRNHY